MSLGIAAVIIFVLYLIDKHGRWRQAGKIVLALAALALLGVGGVIAYDKYESWQQTKAERLAAVKVCVDRNGGGPTTQKACEVDASFTVKLEVDPSEINSVVCGVDAKGRIVLDDKGGCVPPPPPGYVIDAPTQGDVFDRVVQGDCRERLMKQVPYKLPTGAVLESAIEACKRDPRGKWAFESKTNTWIDRSSQVPIPQHATVGP